MADKKNKQKAPEGTVKKVLLFISGYKALLLISLLTAAAGVVLNLLIPLFFGNAIDLIIEKGNVDFDGIKAILIKTSAAVLICAECSLSKKLVFGIFPKPS